MTFKELFIKGSHEVCTKVVDFTILFWVITGILGFVLFLMIINWIMNLFEAKSQ